jgi:hypothetical protein
MLNGKRRIAVAFHKNDPMRSALSQGASAYSIDYLSKLWREDGHEVIYLFGTSEFVPADVVIVHIDLSVVPDEYLEFAARYPVAVNGGVHDIRKSTFSTGILKQNDHYDGKVIVKSDLNYAGVSERYFFGCSELPLFPNPNDYRIFDHLSQVPKIYFDSPEAIAEKFEPEIENGFYCLRNYHFLGDRTFCLRWKSQTPIVNGRSRQDAEEIEPHPEIVAARERLKFDYGKFDYVVVDGKPILFDINKTEGNLRITIPEIQRMMRLRAQGLYSFFS